MKKIKVGVLMGGKSSERDVSLMTVREIIKNIDKDKYKILLIDVPRELEKLDKIKTDVVLIALHGMGGEDGTIQGYLDTLGIKYTGSGVLASAIGMNKKIFRMIAERNNFLMPSERTKVPCVVKPTNGGSSVGVTIVKKKDELERAIEEAKKFDDEIIIEEYIKGVEVSCGIIGDLVLPVIEIVPRKDFFNYEAKYIKGMSEEICPARLPKNIIKKIQNETKRIYKTIKAEGYARVDFIVRKGKVYLLEINTLPGLTSNSLLPMEAMAIGISYSQLLDKIIELALKK
ncbi:MAG: D-alanine--D-alanine ligase [Candidatus Shapirobacteria bacterium]|nr:D-alanine--D-alanine ligase [Candidatus Shapirobacteria bacterium]